MAKKGTCGACFRPMTLKSDGKVVRHGWSEVGGKRRVGAYGNVEHTGPCFGAGWLPFEASPECTEAFVTEVLFPMGLRAMAHLKWLEGRPELVFEGHTFAANFREVRELGLRRRNGYASEPEWNGYYTWSVKLRPGDAASTWKTHPEDWGSKIPGYEEHLAGYVATAKRNWEGIASDGLYCLRAIEGWKPAEIAEVKKAEPLVHGINPRTSHFAACGYRVTTVYGGRRLRTTSEPEKITCPKCKAAMAT